MLPSTFSRSRFIQPAIQALILSIALAMQPLLADEVVEVESAISITNGTVSVFRKTLGESSDVLIHFHGASNTLRAAFERSEFQGVLVVVNFPGLSSAYSKPFVKNAKLFDQILGDSLAATSAYRAESTDEWRRVCVSSFSAGYGATREILKTPPNTERIDGVVTADSIYAGIHEPELKREVDKNDMRDFLQFAELAVECKKTFVLTHSNQSTPYASTTETANYLIDSLQIERQNDLSITTPKLHQTSSAGKGKFIILGFSGTTGDEHMQHLHHIDLFWNRLQREDR